MTETNKKIDTSGLNIIRNPDESFTFEWDNKDPRWSWMNTLTDDQMQTMIEKLILDKQSENDN